MNHKIFYCWQSDLPGATNRFLVGSAITKAIKKGGINGEVDQDARGTSGLVDIPQSLLQKIANSSVFVCDLSIVNGIPTDGTASKVRPMPNPNVMFELGYAVATHGWTNVIGIFNAYYGSFGDLPFDLGWRTPISYTLRPDASKAEIRQMEDQLAARLAKPINTIIGSRKVEVPEIDRLVAIAMRDALTAMRFPLHIYCNRAEPQDYYGKLRPILDSFPPDASGSDQPDKALVEPIVATLRKPMLLQPCEDQLAPVGLTWAQWIVNGIDQCIASCQKPLDRHSANADTRLIAALERLSDRMQKYLFALRHIPHSTDDHSTNTRASMFLLVIVEMMHAERVWRSVIGAIEE